MAEVIVPIDAKSKVVAESPRGLAGIVRALGEFFSKDGVNLEDYSRADQERMRRGERPLGRPEHPNV